MSMSIRIAPLLGAFLALSALLPASAKEPHAVFVSHYENVLGTSLEFKAAAVSEQVADLAEQRALAEIDRLDAILSGYRADSEFSRWQRTQGEKVLVSSELFEILRLFERWQDRTYGALNAAAEVAGKLWRSAAVAQRLPGNAALAQASSDMQQKHWMLDENASTATHLSKAPLMLNTFVKSYIIRQAALAAMTVPGVHGVVVNIGGDLVVIGDYAEVTGITDPRANADNDAPIAVLLLQNGAMATSGNYRRGYRIQGRWYSHIIDPRTAKPASKILSATVIAPHAEDAGALATAFNVLSPEQSLRLLAEVPGAECLLITSDGKRIASAGWPANNPDMAAPVPDEPVTRSRIRKQAPEPWKSDFELAVTLEITRFGERARRPFVAVWIENDKKETVRTLALWYDRPRWLPDLKVWYRKNFTSYTNGKGTDLTAISSATRPPGKYLLRWDGKDDQGNYVEAGHYTVYIEVVREHGTYQLLSQPIECNLKPKQIKLTGNVEVASASLEYRKKPRR